jgi:hypothetical protein
MANDLENDGCVTIRPLTPLRTRHKVNVVGGAAPTGKLPYGVGSGIFGYARCDDEGIFSERQWPIGNKSGVFFNPYARTNIGLEQPDMDWTLLRRPGRPLFPGSSARGIVLIGPSMGNDGTETQSPWGKLLIGAAVVGVGLYFAKKILTTVEGEGL